jgi:hypothetical protein
MLTTTINPGVLVEHSVWGRGKVLNVNAPHLTVHFPSLGETTGGPERKLQLSAPQLSLSPVQSDPLLDLVSLEKPKRRTGTRARPSRVTPTLHTLEQAISWFETTYPGKFANPDLRRDELDYKRKAHDIFINRFGHGQGRQLLANQQLAAVADGLRELYQETNIPSRFEVMAATDGLKDVAAAGRLLDYLLSFLDEPNPSTFDGLVTAVGSLPAPAEGSRVLTWPNVTILPFLADPTRFMVLKPGISRRAANRVGLDLVYSFPPQWHTYEALLTMSATLLERLAPLGATDYIDVQSFMWVTQALD